MAKSNAVSKKRTPSPAPTITLDPNPKRELQRSSSEDSLRVIHHAVLFPSTPNNRVTYIRRIFETDADLIKRQLAAIALQPLTYAEELKARRKQLEIKAEKRKQEKAAVEAAKNGSIPEISIVPASGKQIDTTITSPTKGRGKGNPLLGNEKVKTNVSKPLKSKPTTDESSRQRTHLNVRMNHKRKNDTTNEKGLGLGNLTSTAT